MLSIDDFAPFAEFRLGLDLILNLSAVSTVSTEKIESCWGGGGEGSGVFYLFL
jgi:hypothetical protein